MKNNLVQLYEAIVKTAYDKELELIQLRYKELNEQNIFDGDIDYLINPADINAFLKIVFIHCEKNNISFSINRKKLGKTQLFLYSQDAVQRIHLELWQYLEVVDNTKKQIFWNDIKPFIKNNTLDLKIEALYYLSHLKTKAKSLSHQEVQARIHYYHTALENAQIKEVSILYEELLKTEDISTIGTKANAALSEYGILKTQSLKFEFLQLRLKKFLLSSYFKLLKRIKLVPFIGPDGVGKTTIIDTLVQNNTKNSYYRFKKLFRKSFIYQLFFKYKKKSFAHHNIDAKNQFDDHYNKLVIFSALLHYIIFVGKWIIYPKTTLSDRYFNDFLLKNTRFSNKKIQLDKDTKLLLAFIPRTYFSIQLDADSQAILSRKKELSEDDIHQYKYLLFELYLQKPSVFYLYLNTTQSLTSCIKTIYKENKAVKVIYE